MIDFVVVPSRFGNGGIGNSRNMNVRSIFVVVVGELLYVLLTRDSYQVVVMVCIHRVVSCS